jgi:sensor histidine kinase regulating citrate/malate metabolism
MFVLLIIPFRPSLSDSEYEKCIRYELGVIMPVLGLVIPFLLITIISRRYVVERTQVQEDYISAELDYLNQYKRDQNEIRDFRHEIMSNLASLSAMYTDENYDEAGEHLKALLGNVRAMSPKFVTGDEMLDCILGMKSSKMEEEGIEFTVDGILDGGLGMKPVDVCSIFANAIDNAIEACEKLPGGRWIKLSMKRTDKFFSIVLSNSVYKKEDIRFTAILFGDGERVTTKKDRDHHGFGTQNMKATITKYDGIMKINNSDKEFTLSIVIPRAA